MLFKIIKTIYFTDLIDDKHINLTAHFTKSALDILLETVGNVQSSANFSSVTL